MSKHDDIRVVKRPPSTWAQSVRQEINDMVDRRVDKAVEVSAELPLGVVEHSHPFIGLRQAWGMVEGELLRFHYCAKCGGWVKGEVREGYVSDLRPHQLSGRRGYTYKCGRCSWEIAFNGVVS